MAAKKSSAPSVSAVECKGNEALSPSRPTNQLERVMLVAIRKPLVALVLGLLPFVLFVGIYNTVTINGELVREESINILGLVLAVIGLGLAVRSFGPVAEHTTPCRILAIAAILVCILQIPATIGLYSPKDVLASAFPSSDLPPLAYGGLNEANRRIPESILAKNDPAETRRSIIGYKLAMIDDANRHMAYAGLCHEGQYRVDAEAVEALPEFLTEEERADLAERVESVRRAPPTKCSERMTRYQMGELVDNINRASDMVQILIDGYPAQLAGEGR